MRSIAIVCGHEGRLGRAFAHRLAHDGFEIVTTDNRDAEVWPAIDVRYYVFDFAYAHGDTEGHIARAAAHLADWRRLAGIFIPSSLWVGDGTPYGAAKLVIEQMVAFYRVLGANAVTDRIGYFPGDDVAPDPREHFIDRLVTGDELYARVMAKLIPGFGG